MALSKTVKTPQEFEASNAYHKVDSISIIGKNTLMFAVTSHKEKNSSNFKNMSFTCNYDIDGSNPIKQAYAYLKTLPEFAGATDC